MNGPSSPRSERAVLGLLITRPDISMKILSDLENKPEVFSLGAHQVILKIIQLLISKEVRNYDPQIIISELEKRNELENAGGTSYILQITNDRCSASNVDGHIKSVIDAYLLRRLLNISEEVSQKSLEGLKSPEEIIGKLTKDLQNVRSHSRDSKIYFPEGRVERRLNQIIERNKQEPLTIGYPNVDHLMLEGYLLKHISVIAGRPGMGKTTWIKNAIRNLCMRGFGAVLFATEESAEVNEDAMDSLNTGIPYDQIYWSRNWTEGDPRWAKIIQSQEEQEQWKYSLVADRSMSTDDVWDLMYKITNKHEVHVVFFDLFDKFTDINVEENKPQRVGRGLGTISKICEEFNIHGVVSCQVPRRVEQRPNKRPRLSDLKDSGSYEEMARQVAFLYRDLYYNPDAIRDIMEFNIAKQNNGPSGANVIARFSCRMEIKELIPMQEEKTSSISTED